MAIARAMREAMGSDWMAHFGFRPWDSLTPLSYDLARCSLMQIKGASLPHELFKDLRQKTLMLTQDAQSDRSPSATSSQTIFRAFGSRN
jgi:hypothetical protein